MTQHANIKRRHARVRLLSISHSTKNVDKKIADKIKSHLLTNELTWLCQMKPMRQKMLGTKAMFVVEITSNFEINNATTKEKEIITF